MAKKSRSSTASRSLRGTSRSERMREYFEAQLNNVQPEHQALFRRLWMRMQGEAKNTGKAPYERFYDWLNEHPEALVELEERLQPADEEIARAERNARKRAGLSLEAPEETPAKAAANARSVARWQLKNHREDKHERTRANRSNCRIDITTNADKVREAKLAERNLRFDDEECAVEFAELAPSAARSVCKNGRKRAKLAQRLIVLGAQQAKDARVHDCRQSAIQTQIDSINHEIKLLDNVTNAELKVKRQRPVRVRKENIPF